MPGTAQTDIVRLVREMPLKNLAHLGDAVFELFEREKQTLSAATVENLHKQVVSRVNSREQARLLLLLKPLLSEAELDIVRRARNLKPTSFRRNVEQAVLRQATAFEALIGYLYLTDEPRLQELLSKTTQ
jgi:ribonuclease-3 family protein